MGRPNQGRAIQRSVDGRESEHLRLGPDVVVELDTGGKVVKAPWQLMVLPEGKVTENVGHITQNAPDPELNWEQRYKREHDADPTAYVPLRGTHEKGGA